MPSVVKRRPSSLQHGAGMPLRDFVEGSPINDLAGDGGDNGRHVKFHSGAPIRRVATNPNEMKPLNRNRDKDDDERLRDHSLSPPGQGPSPCAQPASGDCVARTLVVHSPASATGSATGAVGPRKSMRRGAEVIVGVPVSRPGEVASMASVQTGRKAAPARKREDGCVESQVDHLA